MKIARILLLSYVFLLSVFIASGAAAQGINSTNPIFFLLFLPVLIYLTLTIIRPNEGHKFLLYYNFILTTIMAISGFLGAKTLPEYISAALFIPLNLYFWLLVLPKRFNLYTIINSPSPKSAKSQTLSTVDSVLAVPAKQDENNPPKGDVDLDRRMFLKLIGSAGLAFFFLSLFSRKIENSFFPSRFVNPPTSAVSDNPAASNSKNPTDGYRVSEIDDATPSYYGFLDDEGNWFIMQESDTGAFRYCRGNKNFRDNWSNRANLKYDYFDVVF